MGNTYNQDFVSYRCEFSFYLDVRVFIFYIYKRVDPLEHQSLKDRNAELISQVKALEDDIGQLKSKMDESNSRFSIMTNQLNQLNSKISSKNQEFESLKTQKAQEVCSHI
jgi:TolA-binding protein